MLWVDHDGKFCDVWYQIKQKYPHIKGMKDTANATLKFLFVVLCFIFATDGQKKTTTRIPFRGHQKDDKSVVLLSAAKKSTKW